MRYYFLELEIEFSRQVFRILKKNGEGGPFVLHMILNTELQDAAYELHKDKMIIKHKVQSLALQWQLVGLLCGPSVYMKNLNFLTFGNISNFKLFKFLSSPSKGSLPIFHHFPTQSLLSLHSHHSHEDIFRHPLVTCEVEKRVIADKIILSLKDNSVELYLSSSPVFLKVCSADPQGSVECSKGSAG